MEILTDIGNKIGFDWRLALVHFINFSIIFILLVRFALPRLQKVVQERNKKIKEGLSMREDAQKIVDNAEDKAGEIVKVANNKASELFNKSEENAKKLIEIARTEAEGIRVAADQEKNNAKESGLREAQNILERDMGSILTQIANSAFSGKVTAETNADFVKNIFEKNYAKK